MVATVQIGEKNGAGATFTDKTSGNIRFKNADNATVDLVNPLVIPPSSYDYSYEKWLRGKITVAPSQQISSPKVYTDGSSGMGTGVEVYAKPVTSYATPAEITSFSGYSDLFGYTSGSPLSLGASTYSSTGEFADHLVLGCRVDNTATQGLTSSETLTYAWDEI